MVELMRRSEERKKEDEESLLVSIIVPVYNSADYLNTCLESLVTQSYEKVEVIIVYDQSTDDSLKICEDFQNRNSNIRLHINEGPKKGVSRARNQGIGISQGEYIMFVDADDWIEPQTVESLLARMRECGADCAIGSYVWQKPTTKHFKKPKQKEGFVYDKITALQELFLCRKYHVSPWCKMFRSDFIKDKKSPLFFDEGIHWGEDVPFVFEYISRSNKVFWTSEKFYHYTKNPQGLTNSKLKKQKGTIDFIQRWEGLMAYLKLLEICRKDFPQVENYVRSWFFLLGVELLYYMISQRYKNPEKKALLKEMLKENFPHYKLHRRKYLSFRRYGNVAYRLLRAL